jgi:4-diphosphocytidyl-2-C-methyl-D-erythritol kinase
VDADHRTAEVLAHAKVNLFLAVGARLADGYHEVTTVLQAIELADELVIETVGDEVSLTCTPDLGVADEDNLAWRAAEAWRRETGAGAHIRLAKRIPVGAGLGGGSSDAAAVLSMLAARSDDDGGLSARVAAGLGADVPFFLGPGTALMGGRGDRVLEVLPTPTLDIVVVNPGIPAPTSAVYALLDRMIRPVSPSADAIVAAVRSGDRRSIADTMHNDMADAAASLVPEVRLALRFLEGCPGVLRGLVAGSGSSVFGVCEDAVSAHECARAAEARGWWSCATRTSAVGVSVGAGRTRSGTGSEENR